MYFFVGILLVVVLIIAIFNHRRKRKICKKLLAMCCEKKCELLSEIIEPFGYCYVPSQDIFSTTVNAPQRSFGYTALFDRYASHFNMIFDCLPIYFDYKGHTWLIEFWKGQYGINLGCEVGIYKADSLVATSQQKYALFHSVDDSQMLPMQISLSQNDTKIAQLNATHWWLTAFDMGAYSSPESLSMHISITFPNQLMMNSFINSLKATNKCQYFTHGLKVQICFAYCTSCNLSWFQKLFYCFKQWQNRQSCRLFLWITKPFSTSLDRLLCLYFYLPSVFRRIFLNKKRKKCHKKCYKKCCKCCK